MDKHGPLIIIDDDEDDRFLFEQAYNRLNLEHKLLFFADGQEALDYLTITNELPFLILSDINMPRLDGFALKEKLRTDAALHVKTIPYVFFSTAAGQQEVTYAYSSLSAQGYFVKPDTMAELEAVLGSIMKYWKLCATPNNYR